MLKKAKIAENNGMLDLAQMLLDEIKEYQKAIEAGIGTAAHVYCRMEEIIMDSPNIAYDDLVEAVAFEFGSTRQEFEPSYKRLRRVFDNYKRLYR